MKQCLNCKYARRACADGYIACIYWEKQKQCAERTNVVADVDKFYEGMRSECKVDTISHGWAYVYQRPNQTSESTSHPFGGLQQNNVILFERDFSCKHFEEYSE